MNTFPLQFVALSAQERHWASPAFAHPDTLPRDGGLQQESWQSHAAASHDTTTLTTAGANLTWLPRQ